MISHLVSRLTPSATVEIQATLAALTAQGVDIVRLNAGEPDSPTPEVIVHAAQRALTQGKTRYTAAAGVMPLREAIAAKLARDNALHYEPSDIVVTTGAKQALVSAMMAVLNPGDEVIIMTPAWVSYPEMVTMAGAVPVFVPTDETYQPDIDAVRRALTPRTRMLIVNSPNNPTGAVYTKDALSQLAKVALERHLWVIADEIYEKLVYGDATHHSIAAVCPDLMSQTLLVNGFSKAYAMTGWRIGYLAAPREVAKAVTVLVGHTTSNATTFVQWAALTALNDGAASIEAMRSTLARRRLDLEAGLAELPGVRVTPVHGAFYQLPNVEGVIGRTINGQCIDSSQTLVTRLLNEAHVAVLPGEAFFAPGTMRLSYAASDDTIAEGLRRIKAFLACATDERVG